MAVFHLSTKIFSRKNGDSAVMKAAYRAGERLFDERTGEPHDYSHRRGVEHAEVVMPTGSIWAPNRSELWNAVERKNKRADSQVAREFEVSLPSELDADRRRKLAIAFTREIADRYSIATDVAIHAPSHAGDKRNHHAHILTSTNKVDGLGFGNKARELDLVAHNMSGKLGQSNEIEWLRARWAEMVNLALAECEVAVRVDHRSYERQALAAGHDVKLANLPTVHLGPQASALERRGIATVPGDLNREVKIYNLELERVRRQEKAEAERRVAPTPSPTMPDRAGDASARRDRLRRELQSLLQLDAPPTAAESMSAIKRRREELWASVDKRIRENKELQFREMQLRLATGNFQALREQHSALQREGRRLLEQAEKLNRHAQAVGKWSEKHPMKARLVHWGILKSDRLRTATSEERKAHLTDFRRAGNENDQLLQGLAEARKKQADAEQALEQVREKVDSEARSDARELSARFDQAELLVADLRRIEEAEQQARKLEAVPIARIPDTDRDDEPHRRPTP